MDAAARPLAGITVVEHGQGVAAQYCGRLLAVLGAQVIKVEPPGGCALRHAAPLLEDGSGRSALYEYLNADKRAVTCHLDDAAEQARLRQLLAGADILLDDTPVARRPALGLEPGAVRARHPRLVYVSILPFGAVGAHADWRATELNLFHAGGEGYLMPNGLTLEMFPDRPPVKIYGHFAELIGGVSALVATLAAALDQVEGGQDGGQFVDVSVQDANVSIGCFAIQRLGDGVLETRHQRSFKYGGVLECADGYVQILVLEQHQWEELVALMGYPDWVDAALGDPLERGRRGAEINRHLRAWARVRKVADLVAAGQERGVPIAPYNDPAAILVSGHVKARRTFGFVEGIGDMFTAPFQFDGQPMSVRQPARPPGADNDEIWGRS
jgi:crotonobetainyl-CoA:carnitine CoA-transferase CaiB-like acyl-CoA transferase